MPPNLFFEELRYRFLGSRKKYDKNIKTSIYYKKQSASGFQKYKKTSSNSKADIEIRSKRYCLVGVWLEKNISLVIT